MDGHTRNGIMGGNNGRVYWVSINMGITDVLAGHETGFG